MYEPFFSLFAANGSIIKTYGTQIFELDLGLRRNFIWKFIIADVSKPIIGSDFLKYFDLLPDLKNFSLVDRKTLLKVSAKFSNEPSLELNMIQNSNEYHKLLERYPALYSLNKISDIPTNPKVYHHIETSGPPVKSKVRRLDPKRLDLKFIRFHITEFLFAPKNYFHIFCFPKILLKTNSLSFPIL